MFRLLNNLSRILRRGGFKKEASLVFLLKYAGYEDEWKSLIEQHAAKNKYPFNDWFNGAKRVYLPFKQEEGDLEIPIDEEVETALEEYGYQITDYLKGYCVKDGRTYRIGKVINILKNSEIKKFQKENTAETSLDKIKQYWDRINNLFINSEYRTNKKYLNSLVVVFSQDPHDIAQMSYDRNWTSCMELGRGSQYENIFCEVESGGFIAYLTTENDKELKNPLARLSIRRFVNQNGISFARPEDTVYGNEVPGFEEFVKTWVAEKNQERYKATDQLEEGLYTLKGGGYSDSFYEVEVTPPKEKDKLIQWFLEPPDFKTIQWLFEDNYYDDLDSNGYWDYEVHLDFVDEDYSGTKYFDTKEEAEVFKNEVQYADMEDAWLDYFINEEEMEQLEEEGVLDDVLKELRENRYSITRIEEDHEDKVKKETARRIISLHIHEIDTDLANTLIEYALKNKLHHNLYFLYINFPNLLTKERFLESNNEERLKLINYFDTNNPRKADELYQLQKVDVKEQLDINGPVIKEKLKNARISGHPRDRLSASGIASRTAFDISNLVASILSGKIDDEMYQIIKKFLFEDVFKIKQLNYSDKGVIKSYLPSIYTRAISTIRDNEISPSAEFDFAESLWPHVDRSIWYSDRSSNLDVHAWLFFIKNLGSRAEPFTPMLEILARNIEEDVNKNNRYIEVLEDYNEYGEEISLIKKSLERLEEQKLKEMKTRMRRIKYVLDCIENNSDYSKKYKWMDD